MKIIGFKSAVFTAVVAFAFAASASIEFKSGGAVLRLADANGAVESLVAADGAERLVVATEAFTLQMLDEKGEPTRLKSSDFVFEGYSRVEHVERVGVWRHGNGLVVHMAVTAVDGEFRFKPSVEGIPAGMLLEWFDGPQVCIASNTTLYWPFWDGCEVTDYRKRPWRYRPAGYTPRTAYVVEVKRKNIDGDVEKDVEEKMRLLHVRKNVSKRPVLVYDGEISPRVEADGYFAALIPARKLLGL